jgi:RimJ/RimL family protein N-acetyltransferase
LAVIRSAGSADAAAVEAFLLRHVDQAMFPLTNLRSHGLGDGDFVSDHTHAMRVWVVGPGLRGIIGVTRQGMLLPMLPDGGDLAGLAAALDGLDLTGSVGPAVQVRRVLDALGLSGKPTVRDEDEPGFTLDLAALRVPDHPEARLIMPDEDHRALLTSWRAAYHVEVLGTAAEKVTARAEADIAGYLAKGSHRVLLVRGEAVAMTGFNATLPEIVQIGGVYTPPALRGRGYARLAVALHLDQARLKGVTRAVLFAANAAAARAYQAIGFQPAAPVGLVLFDAVQRVGT